MTCAIRSCPARCSITRPASGRDGPGPERQSRRSATMSSIASEMILSGRVRGERGLQLARPSCEEFVMGPQRFSCAVRSELGGAKARVDRDYTNFAFDNGETDAPFFD